MLARTPLVYILYILSLVCMYSTIYCVYYNRDEVALLVSHNGLDLRVDAMLLHPAGACSSAQPRTSSVALAKTHKTGSRSVGSPTRSRGGPNT